MDFGETGCACNMDRGCELPLAPHPQIKRLQQMRTKDRGQGCTEIRASLVNFWETNPQSLHLPNLRFPEAPGGNMIRRLYLPYRERVKRMVDIVLSPS
jgi:hypothetical protein